MFSDVISSDESSDNIEAVENKTLDYEYNASCNNDISFEFSNVISSAESSYKDNDICMTSKCYDINQKLLDFYLRYNPTRNAMEALLNILNIIMIKLCHYLLLHLKLSQ